MLGRAQVYIPTFCFARSLPRVSTYEPALQYRCAICTLTVLIVGNPPEVDVAFMQTEALNIVDFCRSANMLRNINVQNVVDV